MLARHRVIARGLSSLGLILFATAVRPLSGQAAPSVPAVGAVEIPVWAYPLPATAVAPVPDSVRPLHLSGSRVTYVASELHNRFVGVDWFPESHPPAPVVVARGRPTAVMPCGYCHLPNGDGRPENARLAGLPAAYIIQQVLDMRAGTRRSAWPGPFRPTDLMRAEAESVSSADLAEAAAYFSRLVPRMRPQVIETAELPAPTAALGIYRAGSGPPEPLGRRIIEVPQDQQQHELRNPGAEYLAYVPVGSIARGRTLALEGRPGMTPACASCHGPDLRGVGLIPPIAGRFPVYLVRQLLAFKSGTRSTPAGAPMRLVAATLDLDDMISAAAYAATQAP